MVLVLCFAGFFLNMSAILRVFSIINAQATQEGTRWGTESADTNIHSRGTGLMCTLTTGTKRLFFVIRKFWALKTILK